MQNSLELAKRFKPQYDISRLARAVHDSLGGTVSDKLRKLVDDGDWSGIANLRCDPRTYDSAVSYFRDAIPANLLRKVEDLPPSNDIEEATLQKWWAAEHQCYNTNQRLFRYKKGFLQHSDSDTAIARHIDGIRKIIRSWIGGKPRSDLELGFSPGSTLTDRGYRATYGHKLHKSPSSTSQYEHMGYRHFIGTMWHHNMVDAGLTPSIHRGEEYFTVPKTSTVRRAAAMQPSMNISVQLAYGRELRRLLKANTGLSLYGSHTIAKGPGWDLRKAQQIHREVARKSSVDQSFCTIDLSSASDTVARTLVEVLLPSEWYVQLDGIRSHYIKGVTPNKVAPDGESWYLMEKFSAMGNGFTFELESIIFAAVACYVSRQAGYWGELGFDVFVFGDDIIVRDELYRDVEAALSFLGFSVNAEKSFWGKHPFRESCGGDYFNGINVRCVYLENVNDLDTGKLISTANQIKRLSERWTACTLDNLNRVWFTALSAIPREARRHRGPAQFGDTVIYDPEGPWITRCQEGRWEIEILAPKAKDSEWVPWYKFDPATQLACATLGFGHGRRGLLPRDPDLDFEPQWTVLSCT